MSGIALVLHKRGYQVTGSDLKPSRYVTLLEKAGVPVTHRPQGRQPGPPRRGGHLVGHPRPQRGAQEARRRGILVVKRAQALAWLMESGRGIAVCGTHGKTTTTSMISRVLVDAGYDPTFLVGGELNDLGSNARHGEGEFVVCEADESDGSLLLLSPEVAVLTNMELDHHSHYLHVEDVERVFRGFLDRPAARRVCSSTAPRTPGWRRWRAASAAGRVSYGLSDAADYQARDVEPCGTWAAASRSGAGSAGWPRSTLQVPGRHNVLNALACFATLTELGVSPERIVAGARALQRGRAPLPVEGRAGRGHRGRRLRPSSHRAARHSARRPGGRVVAGHRRVPAPPLLAHRVPAGRVRRGAARGRRGRGHRRLRGARGPASRASAAS